MRILTLSNYYPPFEIGGWEQLTRDVVDGLRQRGHEVLVLTSRHRAAESKALEHQVQRCLHLESPDHVHYHPYYILSRRRREAINCRFFDEAVESFNPDLVFINGMWNLPRSLAAHAENRFPEHTVYYIASYWPAETDAHTAYWQDVNPHKWRHHLKRWSGYLVNRQAPPNLQFPRVLCVSNYVRQHLIKEATLSADNTYVVHNGIDPQTFPLKSYTEITPPLRLLYAGRLSPDKGVHTLLEALGLLQIPASEMQLSIVGSGTKAYQAQLENLGHQLNLQNQVHFCGRVPRESMPQILAEHDILVLPSIWPEPLARMTQEGMAVGLIVIGSRTGGTPEILQDGENGLTFEAGNATMLAERINLIYQNPQWRQTLGRQARNTVETRFTFERMLDELETHFAEVLTPTASQEVHRA